MSIVTKVRDEVDDVMETVETRIQDSILTAMEKLMITKVEQAMKLVSASPGRDADSIVPAPDTRHF